MRAVIGLVAAALLLVPAGTRPLTAAPAPGTVPAPGCEVTSLVPGDPGRALDTILVARNALEETALRFARAWAAGQPARMGALLAGGGIRLQLAGQAHAGLSVRQAAAALRDFLRDHEEGEAALLRASVVSGSPDRGSAVIQWSARMAGTSQRVEGTLFLGMIRDGEGRWWVDEIRLVR